MTRTLLALALALPWIAWAVVRTLGLDSGRFLVPAISFTPYVAATALVPVVVALLLRRPAVALLAAAAGAALVAAVAPRAFDGPQAAVADAGPALRVLTVNLGYGHADPEAVMALAADADLVSLQEMTPESIEALDRAGMAERFPHRVLDTRPGAQGSGLLARHPLTDAARPPGLRLAMPEATLRVPGAAPVRVKAIHPVAPLRDDVRVWRDAVRDLPRATPEGELRMLVGDFNATLDHRELRDLLDSGYVDAADATGQGLRGTYPARGRVRIAIDHVLADRRVAFTGADVHLVPGSDHRAVTATLRLPAQTAQTAKR